MKNLLLVGLTLVLLLSGCVPNFEKEEEVVQETNDTKETAIIPKYNISESYYRTILPFKSGEARGLVLGTLNTRLDIDEFETGLMRMAQDTFSVDKYLYQEGQYLEKDTVEGWLGRKLSNKQLEALKDKDKPDEEVPNVGLNPTFVYDKNQSYEEQMKKSPIYLSSILEHNYLIKNDQGQVELGGIAIGLALNSVYYYKLPDDYHIEEYRGFQREVEISSAKLEEEGKKIADEIIRRLRNIPELAQVPIVISLFEQEEISSIVPGHFVSRAKVDANSSKLGKWEDINEEYHFFPSTAATNAYPEDAMKMEYFKADIDDYFSNYTGVIGQGFYKNEDLQELTITIPMQFYGKGEVIGFTQYVTGLVMEHFPSYVNVRIYITSGSGQESIIIRDAGEEEPYVHIYN
ncbi:CamS family sex pheromone protein [Litchfieldia alkalitelluris]|uniref:CamS family sex pheromone protein n=1 Tax=Litchfieldia alkalitelluris TaxID=304268 RepID=UPI000998CC3E|nr:CamS family sex pheromone protein [Litchfieldia alkalitelluris]